MIIRRSFACAAAILLAACGGGGGGSQPGGAPPTTQPASNVPVQLAIVIPQKIGSAHGRAPRYVSPATSTVKVSVNGGTPQSYPVANGAPCSSSNSSPSGTCVIIVVNSPPGNDTFTITLLDASSNVLSQGTVQQNVVADQTNSVNVNLDGSIAALRVALSNPSPPNGTAAKLAVTLLPVDAAGFTVVGAPGTLPNITVTDGDTSAATGLYLAGADGTCATQAAAPSASVTTAQSGRQYVNVCLSYSGAPLASATISAQIAGGPFGSATLTPSAPSAAISGFWMIGRGSQDDFGTLERVDASLVATAAIAGSNTDFGAVIPGAVAVEPASGDVELLTVPDPSSAAVKINAYPHGASGNVAPVRGTTFSIPGPEQLWQTNFALDGQGSAYVAGFAVPITGSSPRPGQCTIFRVPLTNGTVTPAPAANCVNLVPDFYRVAAIHGDSHGRIYLGITRATTFGDRSIFRFVRNADGSLTPESAITIVATDVSTKPSEDFGIDRNGNVYLGIGNNGLFVYPGTAFVPGQNTTVTAIDSYSVGFVTHVAIDPSGNVVFTDAGSSPKAIHAGSHGTDAAQPNWSVYSVSSDTMTASGGSGSALSALPSAMELPGANTVTVSEAGYSGPITETDNCANIATVSPAQGAGPSQTFAIGQATAGGSCTITFADAGRIHTAALQVGSTVTVLHAQGRRRP